MQTQTESQIAPEQIEFFVENGYLVMDDLLSTDEIEEMRADTLKIARGEYPNETLKPVAPELGDAQVLENILAIHHPINISPVMMKYAKHPKICGVLSQIVGAHLPHWDGSVKCMQSMLFVKPPTFPGQAWHQDELFIPTRDRSLCGAWIALDPATIENGCLWVVPKSHQTGYLWPQRGHNSDEFDPTAESYGFDESEEVPVEVPLGSVVFFNGYLLHRSLKNRSEIYRRVLVNHYMNAWSLLPWWPLDDEPIATCDRRLVTPVAGTDPYDWKGFEPPVEVILRPRSK